MESTMAKVSFFKTAQATKTGKKKASDNKFRTEVKGLSVLASIDAVMKTLETFKKEAEAKVKAQMRDTFVLRGCAVGRRPDNYVGLDGAATASLELRKRSDRSPVDDYQAEALREEGISLETHTTYSLNTEVLTPEVMVLVEKALNKVPGIPVNLFTVTEKTVVADEALNQIFEKGEAKAKLLLDMVGVLAVKPKLDEDIQETIDRVFTLVKEA
jgi:hypothetical protein